MDTFGMFGAPLLAMLIYLIDAVPQCKDGWVMHNNRCYLFSRQKSTWASASYICAELGGSLAALETKAESDFIEDHVLNNAYLGCFNDRLMPRLLPRFHYSDMLTNRWCLEQCRKENFMYAGTQYYSQCFCGNATYTKFMEYGSAPESDCYTPCQGDQREMCGGDWRLSVYLTAGRQTWVGGTDIERKGVWMWFPSRTPLTYTNWKPFEPNNQIHPGFDTEHCMSLFPSDAEQGRFMWNDELCHTRLHFVCEMSPIDKV